MKGTKNSDTLIANKKASFYDGLGGFDILSYAENSANSGTQGITVDFANQTISDPWGGTDTYRSIEWVRGSVFDDVFKFDRKESEFQPGEGLAGDDRFVSKNGLEVWLIYVNESSFGGSGGVKVDLSSKSNGKTVKGTVIDTFGDTDATVNIHRVEGTRSADSFVGSRLRDHFNGLEGKDRYDGGKGNDVVYFDSYAGNTQKAAISVNLAKQKVFNDGFNNTETIRNVEGVRGSQMKDRLIGDKKSNMILGDGNKDVLTGKGGKDFFVYGAPNTSGEFGDRITDFKSGVDKIVFRKDYLPDMDNKVRFANSDKAPSANKSSFFFDSATHKLFWDPDGRNGSEDAVMVAKLDGVNSLKASDISIEKSANSDYDFWV